VTTPLEERVGYVVTETEDDECIFGRLAVGAFDAVIYGCKPDVEGRAVASRLRPLAEALASFLTYGGTIGELNRLLTAFCHMSVNVAGAVACGALRDFGPPEGATHVMTRVDAVRRHVFVLADGNFLNVVEGEETTMEVLTPQEQQALLERGEEDDEYDFAENFERHRAIFAAEDAAADAEPTAEDV
jgi:hypothetical protein